ncbi:MAG: hypothetical protein ABSH04_02275 [Acidimicrobiales bacterium]|jgi:hypothetical protein
MLLPAVLFGTVEKADPIRFEVFRWIQCSAGKSQNAGSAPMSSLTLSAAFGCLGGTRVSKR